MNLFQSIQENSDFDNFIQLAQHLRSEVDAIQAQYLRKMIELITQGIRKGLGEKYKKLILQNNVLSMIRECIKSSHHDVELIQRVLLNIIEALNIKLDEIQLEDESQKNAEELADQFSNLSNSLLSHRSQNSSRRSRINNTPSSDIKSLDSSLQEHSNMNRMIGEQRAFEQWCHASYKKQGDFYKPIHKNIDQYTPIHKNIDQYTPIHKNIDVSPVIDEVPEDNFLTPRC